MSKEAIQEQYFQWLQEEGKELSFDGLTAWFDQDGVLFPRTSDLLWKYLGEICHLSEFDQKELSAHYIDSGRWRGWKGRVIMPELIETLTTKEIFQILGYDIKIVGSDEFTERKARELKIVRIGAIFELEEGDVHDIYIHHFTKPEGWPGWKGRMLTGNIINNLVRDFFKTPDLHTMIEPDPRAKEVLDMLYAQRLDINYFSTRRGDPRLHDETVRAIERANFPNSRGHIYTMAWDDWQGDLVGPLRNSTVWKVTKPVLHNHENKQVVIVDDYFQVCKAASEAGLWSILVEAEYNHPAAPDVNVPYNKAPNNNYIHQSYPGMTRISSLGELPFALYMISEQIKHGSRDPRWVTGSNILDRRNY